MINHRVVQIEPQLHKPQRLPEARSRLAPVHRRITHHPHHHAAGLRHAPQLRGNRLEVEGIAVVRA